MSYDAQKRVPVTDKSIKILGFGADTELSTMLDEVILGTRSASKAGLPKRENPKTYLGQCKKRNFGMKNMIGWFRKAPPEATLLIPSLVIAIVLQAIFATGYPLNAGRSDNTPYLQMILSGSSNLILAPGYGFVLNRIVMRTAGVPIPEAFSDIEFLQSVHLAQNILHLSLFLLAVFLLWRLTNAAVASIFVLGNSLYVGFWGGLNSASPEWLQGDLLILSLLLAATAAKQKTFPRILVFGTLTGLVFSLAFLVKFNSLVVIFGLITIFVFSGLNFKKIALGLAAATISAFSFISFFSSTYHEPRTGTETLSYATSWNLTSSMDPGYLERPNEDLGIEALRWKALIQWLPPGSAFAYPTIETGAYPDVKEQSLLFWNDILAMNRDQLIEITNAGQFKQEYSHFSQPAPIYWNVGLAEAEKLGRAVFFEYLLDNPGHVFNKAFFGLLKDWGVYQEGFLPVEQDPKTLVLDMNGPNANNDLSYSFAEVSGPPQFQPYWNPSMVIDKFAFDLASTLEKIRVPVWIEYLLTLLAIPAWFLLRRSGLSLLLVSALLSQAAFLGASWLLVGMRHKEEVAILPITVLVYSLVIFAIAKYFKRLFLRNQNKVN